MSEAGMRDSAIANMKAAIIPSDVFSNPSTERGKGKGLKVSCIYFLEFPVAILKIALFI